MRWWLFSFIVCHSSNIICARYTFPLQMYTVHCYFLPHELCLSCSVLFHLWFLFLIDKQHNHLKCISMYWVAILWSYWIHETLIIANTSFSFLFCFAFRFVFKFWTICIAIRVCVYMHRSHRIFCSTADISRTNCCHCTDNLCAILFYWN